MINNISATLSAFGRSQIFLKPLTISFPVFNDIITQLLLCKLQTSSVLIVCSCCCFRLEEGLHQANFVFTFLFTAEMVLKMAGLGPWRYLTDAWSLFDAAVVAFSLVEVITELQARSSSNGGLTALRYGV